MNRDTRATAASAALLAAFAAVTVWAISVAVGCSRTPAPPQHTHWPSLHPAVPPAALTDAADPGPGAIRRQGVGFYSGDLHELEAARDGVLTLDLNGDGVIDGTDLGLLLLDWENPYTGADLGRLLLAWGVEPDGVIIRHDTGDGRWWYITSEAGVITLSGDGRTATLNPHTSVHRMWQPDTGWVDYEFAAWTHRLGGM